MTTKELLQSAREITQENIDYIQKSIVKLSENQINWRPNPGVWSISEILAHMNEYSHYYHPVFKRRIENTRFNSTKEDFISSPLGRSAWKSMKLGRLNNVKRKFKAQKGYNPTIDPSLVKGNEVDQFLLLHTEFFEVIDLAENVNLKRVKIPISISKIIRLRLGDALLFVTYHNQRHLQQIKNLRESRNFPKK